MADPADLEVAVEPRALQRPAAREGLAALAVVGKLAPAGIGGRAETYQLVGREQRPARAVDIHRAVDRVGLRGAAHPARRTGGDQPVGAVERDQGEAVLAREVGRQGDRLVEVEGRQLRADPVVVAPFAGARRLRELDPGGGNGDVGPRIDPLARHQPEVAAAVRRNQRDVALPDGEAIGRHRQPRHQDNEQKPDEKPDPHISPRGADCRRGDCTRQSQG